MMDKSPLTHDKSPFLVYFKYGENCEGYLAYNNMVLQFKDAVDVLKVMHSAVDFIFLFDHSAGHSKQQPDGLNQYRMNRLFGGKNAAAMQSTIAHRTGGGIPWSLPLNSGTWNHSVACILSI